MVVVGLPDRCISCDTEEHPENFAWSYCDYCRKEKRKPGYEDPAAFDHVTGSDDLSDDEREWMIADKKMGDPNP